MDVKCCDWFDDHWYRIQHDETIDYLPSVTSILSASPKPFLAQWRGEVGNDEANKKFFEAGERGTRIHNGTLYYDEGGAVIFQPWNRPIYTQEQINEISAKHDGKMCVMHYQDEYLQVLRWSQWLKITGATIIEKEKIVYSLDLKCAGTLDRVVGLMPGSYMVNGSKPVIIENPGEYVLDIKSSKEIDDDYYLQTAAYQKMYDEMTGKKLAGRIIVHTNAARIKNGIEGIATHVRGQDTFDEDFEAFMHIKATWLRKFPGKKPKIFEMPSILSTIIEGEKNGSVC